MRACSSWKSATEIFALRIHAGGFRRAGLNRWGGRVDPVRQEVGDRPLDFFQLIELKIRVGNGKDIAGSRLLVNKNAMAIALDLLFDFQQAFALEHDGQNI